jgi:NitT/TauT family transport system substrate-binding protein
MKTLFAAALLGSTLLFSTAADAGSLKLAHSTWVGYGPFYIARDKGFFKEEGVDVEITIMEDTPIKMGALIAGQIDLVASTADEFPIYMKPGKMLRYVLAVDNSKGGDHHRGAQGQEGRIRAGLRFAVLPQRPAEGRGPDAG